MEKHGKKSGEHRLYPCEIHALEHIPKNEDGTRWLIRQDIKPTLPTNVQITHLEFIEIFSDTTGSLNGIEVLEKSRVHQRQLGLSDIPRFLTQDPETLWRIALKHTMLFFTGTILVDSFGEEHYPCLMWLGDEWEVIFVASDDELSGPRGALIHPTQD
jgi:hypothetical protein